MYVYILEFLVLDTPIAPACGTTHQTVGFPPTWRKLSALLRQRLVIKRILCKHPLTKHPLAKTQQRDTLR